MNLTQPISVFQFLEDWLSSKAKTLMLLRSISFEANDLKPSLSSSFWSILLPTSLPRKKIWIEVPYWGGRSAFFFSRFNRSGMDLSSGMSVCRSPGRRGLFPSTSSAGVACMSLCTEVRRAKRIHGSASIHRDPLVFPILIKAAFNEDFKSLCCLSIIPTEAGLYKGENSTMMPSALLIPCQIFVQNVLPLSLRAFRGRPKFFTQCLTNASAHWADVASTNGIASNHLDVLSTIVSKYLCPSDNGRGPTISRVTSWNRGIKTGLGPNSGVMALCVLDSRQGIQFVTKLEISCLILGQ